MFGRIKHKGKKISAMYWKRYHAGISERTRAVHLTVYVERASVPTNTGRKAGYWARVCVGKRGKYKKCASDVSFGRTPTLAMKKALVAAGKDPAIT